MAGDRTLATCNADLYLPGSDRSSSRRSGKLWRRATAEPTFATDTEGKGSEEEDRKCSIESPLFGVMVGISGAVSMHLSPPFCDLYGTGLASSSSFEEMFTG